MEVVVDQSKPASAFVFKTQIDQFSGRLSYVKVVTGVLVPDLEIVNVRDGRKEKLGKLYTLQGKKLEEIKEIVAGDIGIIAKAADFKTNDSLSAYDKPFSFHKLRLPTPVHMLAISALNKKEEDKLNENLLKASEEDLTFQVKFNGETKETVISGMGELQINMILDKIKNGVKIAAETRVPRVAYRETITKKASAEYTHKKQTGGHGQYAKVVFDVEPLERGTGYQFENKLFGQSVSKGFIPGIEKGIHQAMENGIVAGYPVVDVKTAITDGKEHPVDSSEMAFKIASRGAFREATKNANPVLLEPIMNLRVFVEEKNLGDVMSDLSGRRGPHIRTESPGRRDRRDRLPGPPGRTPALCDRPQVDDEQHRFFRGRVRPLRPDHRQDSRRRDQGGRRLQDPGGGRGVRLQPLPIRTGTAGEQFSPAVFYTSGVSIAVYK